MAALYHCRVREDWLRVLPRLKVLFLTHRLPYAPNRGDRIRSFYLLREMSRFADVSLVSLVHDSTEAAMVSEVPFARRVIGLRSAPLRHGINGLMRLPTSRPLTHSLLDAPGLSDAVSRAVASDPPDVTVAYCSGMARLAFEPPLAHVPFVLDMVDVDSAKWARMAASSGLLRRLIYQREARTLRQFEIRVVRHASTTLVVNERERDALLELVPGAPVVAMPNGVDLEAFAPAHIPSASPTVVFCGVMSYAPNIEGVIWFVKQVWPLVRATRPDARFVIVGADPAREVRALASPESSIEVTGAVPAVQPYLASAAMAIAPLWMTQGLQNKVLEALAAGLPVVTTPAVAAGLPNEATHGCTVASSETEFADAVVELLNLAPNERLRRAEAAHLDRLSWSAQLIKLESILKKAVGRQATESHHSHDRPRSAARG